MKQEEIFKFSAWKLIPYLVVYWGASWLFFAISEPGSLELSFGDILGVLMILFSVIFIYSSFFAKIILSEDKLVHESIFRTTEIPWENIIHVDCSSIEYGNWPFKFKRPAIRIDYEVDDPNHQKILTDEKVDETQFFEIPEEFEIVDSDQWEKLVEDEPVSYDLSDPWEEEYSDYPQHWKSMTIMHFFKDFAIIQARVLEKYKMHNH